MSPSEPTAAPVAHRPAARLRLAPPADPTVGRRLAERYPDAPASYVEAVTRWDPTGVVLAGINLGPRQVEGRRYDLVRALIAVNDGRFATYLDRVPPVDELLEVGSIGVDPLFVAMAGAHEHDPGAVYRWASTRPDGPAERVAGSFGDLLHAATVADELVVDTAELRIGQRVARERLDRLLAEWDDVASRAWWRRRVLLDLDTVADDHREPW